MRISDWSSDVCSSDLSRAPPAAPQDSFACAADDRPCRPTGPEVRRTTGPASVGGCDCDSISLLTRHLVAKNQGLSPHAFTLFRRFSFCPLPFDRKIVVEGTSVSVRLDIGGRLI